MAVAIRACSIRTAWSSPSALRLMSAISNASKSPRPSCSSWVDDAENTCCRTCWRRRSVKPERSCSRLTATRPWISQRRRMKPTSKARVVVSGTLMLSLGIAFWGDPLLSSNLMARPSPAMSSTLLTALNPASWPRCLQPACWASALKN